MISEYQLLLDRLFISFPAFEKTGGLAYHPGLALIENLCKKFDHPQKKIKTIHVAGTNGKGSSSHLLAAVFQAAGYRTGLYTSPHLKSFTERIKINGVELSEQSVTDFLNEHLDSLKTYDASFFEITTLMAFYFFAKEQVDIAIIETGMGGRLDATNCITPELSLITNISFDHMQFLGSTLEQIAQEKAGIIKQTTPVVISERQKECDYVFLEKAKALQASIYFAEDFVSLTNVAFENDTLHCSVNKAFDNLIVGMGGTYQEKNIKGVLVALELMKSNGWKLTKSHVIEGFSSVVSKTGLQGRWQYLQRNPIVLCDTAHNEAGFHYTIQQLSTLSYNRLFFVLGVVKDKEVEKILALLPKDAYYYFTMPSIERALDYKVLAENASSFGLDGEPVETVTKALALAKKKASKNDLIYVGGSIFVVSEIL